MATGELFLQRGALFSPAREYRYRLWRKWSDEQPLVVCMLNPSTADERVDDPTIARMSERARRLKCGGLEVVNLFAFRASDPRELRRCDSPIGPENDVHLREVAKLTGSVVCAWGTLGAFQERARAVLELVHAQGASTYALRLNRDGSPAHPLYVPYSRKPEPWNPLA